MLNKLNNLNKFKYNNDNCNMEKMTSKTTNKFNRVLFGVLSLFVILMIMPFSVNAIEFYEPDEDGEFEEVSDQQYSDMLWQSRTNYFVSDNEPQTYDFLERTTVIDSHNPFFIYYFENTGDETAEFYLSILSDDQVEGRESEQLERYIELEEGEEKVIGFMTNRNYETLDVSISDYDDQYRNSGAILTVTEQVIPATQLGIGDVMAEFVSVTIELIEINLSIWELLFYLIMFLMFTGFLLLIIIITWRIYDKATRDIYPHRRGGRNSNKDDDDF